MKEELGVDLSSVDLFTCESLKVNDVDALKGSMPWILDQFEDKINSVYQGMPLESFEINQLDCKSSVVN